MPKVNNCKELSNTGTMAKRSTLTREFGVVAAVANQSRSQPAKSQLNWDMER